ncbi:hypothetical protein ES708_18274 [subsurface metagenome]
MMKNVPGEAIPFSRLAPEPFNPEKDAAIDMYMRNWRESMPTYSHGSLIERDILTRGNANNPETRGAVLTYAERFTYATLYTGAWTTPTTLDGTQEVLYILSGKGTIITENTTADLYPGIGVLVPGECEFTMKNTGDEPLTMYLLSEQYPEGFDCNDDILVVDENKRPLGTGNPHWVGCSKGLFNTGDGLATIKNTITVRFDPMTMFHPHSHRRGTEEVWTTIYGDAHVLIGKQIRSQPPGTAYNIPPVLMVE